VVAVQNVQDDENEDEMVAMMDKKIYDRDGYRGSSVVIVMVMVTTTVLHLKSYNQTKEPIRDEQHLNLHQHLNGGG
jgi:hypothetical protein